VNTTDDGGEGVSEMTAELVEIDEDCGTAIVLEIAGGLFTADDAGKNDCAGCAGTGGGSEGATVPLSTGEGGSPASSSDSESSPSNATPTVEGLLPGESGDSGPSASSPPGISGAMLAAASCRRMRLGKTITGDGRRRWYRAILTLRIK
jgi:hypothetical protein